MECNVAWNKVEPESWPQEQTKFWWDKAHWSITHNRQDPDATTYQPGGAGLLVVNQLAHLVQRPGEDQAGLGCWCWIQLKGKEPNTLESFLHIAHAHHQDHCPPISSKYDTGAQSIKTAVRGRNGCMAFTGISGNGKRRAIILCYWQI